MTSRLPSVFAVVTNFNNKADTVATVRSLQASKGVDLAICVIDNGSTDGSFDYLKQWLDPSVILLRNETNEGVSRSYNRGLRDASDRKADYALIVNNDVEVEPDCIERLVRSAEEPGGPAICAPVMYYFWERSKVWFQGGRVDFDAGEAVHCATLEEFRKLPQAERFITACAMLVRVSDLPRMGFYDERIFMYYDDTDFSLRAARQGLTLDVVEGARLYHKIGASSGGAESTSPSKAYHIFRSGLIFWRKHLGWWKFHRRYCHQHLAKWLNNLDVEWQDPQRKDRAQAIVDALWYFVSGKRNALERPASPPWFTHVVIRRPWLAARLMAFRLG